MKKNRCSDLFLVLILPLVTLVFAGCDMKKNTAFNRRYQALNTRFNVYYNANESFKKGCAKVDESYSPDYSRVIPIFAVSDKSTKGAANGDMARTIEKCELAIQERSMQKKPKKKYEKMRDPAYVSFYNQEEFNSYMDEVWMLLGKAQYFSNDYLAASATFSYVIKHFSHDKNLVLQASIWRARALKEMDWLYEADELMGKIDVETLPYDVENLYYSTMADLKMAHNDYAAALPLLLKAVPTEKDRLQRTRMNFAIAQIYRLLGQNDKAFFYFEEVIKANPNYQMTFNANILQTEVAENASEESMIKRLQKMAKNRNNAEYLDQIYYAMGNVYLSKKDTATAMAHYQISADTSVRNGLEKARTLITMGDLYYGNQNYEKAQPCFSEANSIIDQKHDEYERVSRLAEVLDELVRDQSTVLLQDSLLALSVAPKGELSAAINRVIAKVYEEERLERERLAREREEERLLELEIDNMAVMDSRALGMEEASTWYFYNKATVDKGKLEFRKKFGQRRLEDNWNRRNKNIMVFAEESLAEKFGLDSMGFAHDSMRVVEGGDGVASFGDPNLKKPEYYLMQIPFEEGQKAVAHEQLSASLFNMAVVYEEKLDDYPKALETYEEFVRRYPKDPRAADAYYCCYRISGKMSDEAMMEKYRNNLVEEYPDSKYSKILSNKDYRSRLEKMQVEQDSIYAKTYAAYLSGDFATVAENASYMEKNYPVSNLIPKFMLLNSLSLGKTMGKDTFAASLNLLLERFPSSDVSPMAKDILALINQGNIPSEGATTSSLMSLREEVQQKEAQASGVVASHGFVVNYQTPYLFKLYTDTAKVDQNKLLYETAMYNFTKFLIKDFDIQVKQGVLTVTNLDNYDEALWYINGVIADDGIQKLLSGTQYKYLLVSQENFDLIGKGYTIEQYEQFYKDSIMSRKRNNSVSVQLVGEEKEIEEITKEQKLEVKEGDNLNGATFSVPSQNTVEDTTSTTATPEDARNEQEEMKKSTSSVSPVETYKDSLPQTREESKQSTSTETRQDEEKNEELQKSQEKPKKPQKKYKGLYTYDASAEHVFAILVPSGNADAEKVLNELNKYNSTNHALLNLKVIENGNDKFPQIFVVGPFSGAQLSLSYMKQLVKSAEVKSSFGSVPYRNIVISKENYEVLRNTGNLTVYMELYKRLYLGR